MIKLLNIQKRYDSRVTLQVEQLSLEPGLRYAVIGPNGSGKSTLLRIVAGVLPPDAGTVEMPQAWRQGLGYMPQQPYAFGFSVLRNVQIAFPKPRAAAAPAMEALERVGMAGFACSRGNTLSGGETQRMAIARMIAMPRPLLLLDEPTSATDIAAEEFIEGALLEYCEKAGCTLVFSTHSPAQAQRLAQRVILLNQGKIIEYGPVEKVLFSPVTPEAQSFLRHWRLEPEQTP